MPAPTWSTPLGGTRTDLARDAVVDSKGNLYVIGGAASITFPSTPGTFDPVHDNTPNGSSEPMDAFVTRFAPDGSILASTFAGGRSYDRAYGVELDPQGNVVIAGRAGAGFPVTAGAAQGSFAGGVPGGLYGAQDAFACKLTGDLVRALWCTYLGTTGQDLARDVEVDPAGDVYVAGSTTGTFAQQSWFSRGYQTRPAGGGDGFVMKLNGTTGQVVWATYFGGPGTDGQTPSIRWSPGGLWVVSTSNATASGVSSGAFQRTRRGPSDMHLIELSLDGSRLLYGTYLGGTGDEGTETHDLGVNRTTGDVYVSGQTNSQDFPLTTGAVQARWAGSFDGFLTRFDSRGKLLYSSYLGSPSPDMIEGVLVGPNGDVYLAGHNVDPYALQPALGSGGSNDGILMVFASNGQTELFGRVVGGSGDDQGRAVAFGPAGELYLVGQTTGGTFPRGGKFARALGGGIDAFVTRLR